jgi:hypothetical protein
MQLFRSVVPIFIVVPLVAACGASVTHNPASGGDSSSSSPAPTAAGIEQSGFGGSGGYLWVTSTVHHVPVGQFATVSFNLYGADGTLLATESQTEQAVNPGARITLGTQVTAPQGQPVARIEPTLKVSEHDPVMPTKFSDVVLQLGPVTVGQDEFGSPAAVAELTNPSSQQIPSARVGATCFNQQRTIIGGGSDFPDVVPANGKVRTAARLLVSGTPDHCEMTVQPSDF